MSDLPWKMTAAAWEIFKAAPKKWRDEVAAGRLIENEDGSLCTPQDIDPLRAWVEQDVIDDAGRVVWKAKKREPKK